MAYYAALISLIQLLKEINQSEHPYPKPSLEKHQIHVLLYEKLSCLHELLKDYSPKLVKEAADNRVEMRIRDMARRAQDIIECHISDQSCENLRLDHNIVEKEYHQDLGKVRGEVDSNLEEMRRSTPAPESITIHGDSLQEKLYYANHAGESTQAPSIDNTGGASKAQAMRGRTSMVAFDEHFITEIKEQLCGEPSKLQVVSVVGMGGIGKTILVRNIFDDDLIKYHFDCRAWATVSQDFGLRKVLLDIVYTMEIFDEKLSDADEEELKEHVYKYLKGKRYLIIMDDVWDTKVWDDANRILPNDCNGSRIVITTRLSDLAVSGFVNQMKFLSEDQSWNLFCEKVFCPPELEDTGKLIAKNCRGLPLAIVVVAGLLSKVNPTQYDWKQIATNVSSIASENDEHLSKILSLSYNHLPHHLKSCFLHLGGFPKDYAIPVSKLVKLWVAEGFVTPVVCKSLEGVGEEYLEDLINRNLVLVNKRKKSGKLKFCNVHDLLRDLCSRRGRYENFLHFLHKNDDFHHEAIRDMRRLYVHLHTSSPIGGVQPYVSHVRSLLCFADVRDQVLSVASGFKLLRVLDMLNIRISAFHIELVELLHLRYLALKCHHCCLPPQVIKLQNLQMLIVNGEMSLPSEIWYLPRLRHVMTTEIMLLPTPYGERAVGGALFLKRLQTLTKVVNFRFSSDIIEKIPNLKKLEVLCTSDPYKNWHEFGLNTLVDMRQLEILEIEFSKFMHIAVPLQYSCGCRLPWKDLNAAGSLRHLQILKLRKDSFVGEEWETTEGEFPKLKFLMMHALRDLKHWQSENTHFPCLECLQIIRCSELQKIPHGLGDIPTLYFTDLYYSKLAGESLLEIQKEQQDLGNDVLRVEERSKKIGDKIAEVDAMQCKIGDEETICWSFYFAETERDMSSDFIVHKHRSSL